VPSPPHANIVSGKWLYRHKLNADGSLAQYKAHWVVRGFSQQHRLDYDETFSPVVKPTTIRMVLSLPISSDWPIHQLDVKNAFLHGTLNETVYCQQPLGFVDPARPKYVCKLNKACWIRQLLGELHCPLTRATLVYCDNISVVYLSTNPIHHQWTKHVKIDLHFVRERVALGAVRVLHVPTSLQYVDIFTKGLPTPVFINFRSSLNIRASPG